MLLSRCCDPFNRYSFWSRNAIYGFVLPNAVPTKNLSHAVSFLWLYSNAVLKKELAANSAEIDCLTFAAAAPLFGKINHPLPGAFKWTHVSRTIAMETRAAMHCAHYSDACATMGGNMHKFLIVCVTNARRRQSHAKQRGKCRRRRRARTPLTVCFTLNLWAMHFSSIAAPRRFLHLAAMRMLAFLW